MKKSPLQKIEYDPAVDALYVYAHKAKIHKTIPLSDRLFFDVDKQGRLVGIELLDASLPLTHAQSVKKSRALQFAI